MKLNITGLSVSNRRNRSMKWIWKYIDSGTLPLRRKSPTLKILKDYRNLRDKYQPTNRKSIEWHHSTGKVVLNWKSGGILISNRYTINKILIMNLRDWREYPRRMNHICRMKSRDWVYWFSKVNHNYHNYNNHSLKPRSMRDYTTNNNPLKGNWLRN